MTFSRNLILNVEQRPNKSVETIQSQNIRPKKTDLINNTVNTLIFVYVIFLKGHKKLKFIDWKIYILILQYHTSFPYEILSN